LITRLLLVLLLVHLPIVTTAGTTASATANTTAGIAAGMADDRRGDAYMNAFQPTLSRVPWFPIIGNHEAADGDFYRRCEVLGLCGIAI